MRCVGGELPLTLPSPLQSVQHAVHDRGKIGHLVVGVRHRHSPVHAGRRDGLHLIGDGHDRAQRPTDQPPGQHGEGEYQRRHDEHKRLTDGRHRLFNFVQRCCADQKLVAVDSADLHHIERQRTDLFDQYLVLNWLGIIDVEDFDDLAGVNVDHQVGDGKAIDEHLAVGVAVALPGEKSDEHLAAADRRLEVVHRADIRFQDFEVFKPELCCLRIERLVERLLCRCQQVGLHPFHEYQRGGDQRDRHKRGGDCGDATSYGSQPSKPGSQRICSVPASVLSTRR